jgi:hypothetical protein
MWKSVAFAEKKGDYDLTRNGRRGKGEKEKKADLRMLSPERERERGHRGLRNNALLKSRQNEV